MVARILTAAMAAVWAAFAFVGRAEVVSNCFSVVEYGDRCTHLVCDLEPFAGMEFVLDLSGDIGLWSHREIRLTGCSGQIPRR